MNIKIILITIDLLVSIVLLSLITLQAKGTGLSGSSAFGGGASYSSRLSIEKGALVLTIIFSILFAIFSLALVLV